MKEIKTFICYELLFQALESTQKGERVPSVILEKDEKGYGKLFLGGFKAALNEDFIKMEKAMVFSHYLDQSWRFVNFVLTN